MKKEVEQHLQEKDKIEQSLPSSIAIGPFLVSVEVVRRTLSNKRKALADSALNHFAQKLRKQMDDVSLFLESSKFFYFVLKFFCFSVHSTYI